MLAVALVAGPVALAVPVFVLVGRRWPAVPGLSAAVAMIGAGIGVAADPGSQPGSGQGAFGPLVQVFGALALAAVLAALAGRAWDRPAGADFGARAGSDVGHRTRNPYTDSKGLG